MNYLPSRLSVVVVAVSTLAGCASNLAPQVASNYAEAPTNKVAGGLPATADSYGSDNRVISRGADLQSDKVIRRSAFPYIGGQMVSSTNEDALPAVFNENYTLDFGDGREGRVPLAVVAARLTKLTGVPVRLRGDVYNQVPSAAAQIQQTALVAGTPMPMPTPLPSMPGGGMRTAATSGGPVSSPMSAQPASSVSSNSTIGVDAVNMKWNGKLRDFLDHLTNSLALGWEYRDGAVVIMRMVSETYQLASFNGQQKYSMSAGGTGTGNSGGSGSTQSSTASMQVSAQGEGDARKSIIEAVKSMLASVPGSSVNVSDGTGRIVVVTTKENQAQIRDYIKAENKMLRQMVNVTFDVYSVRTNDTDTQGVDWSLVYKSLSGKAGVSFKSPSSLSGTDSASVGVNVLTGQFAGTSAIINLLRQFGTSVQHRPVTVNTMNGLWDTKTRLNTEGYLKETTPGVASSSGAAGAPGLKTDTITTGDQFSVLPMVMQDNSVMVKYAISLSDNLGFTDVTSGSGETLQRVQTPRIESANANSTIVLAPGETAVITGLTRLISSTTDNRLTEGTPVVFGGSRKVSVSREHFLVLVRATPL